MKDRNMGKNKNKRVFLRYALVFFHFLCCTPSFWNFYTVPLCYLFLIQNTINEGLLMTDVRFDIKCVTYRQFYIFFEPKEKENKIPLLSLYPVLIIQLPYSLFFALCLKNKIP